MKKTIFLSLCLGTVMWMQAQDIKVMNITLGEIEDKSIEVPQDLNGEKCVLVTMPSQSQSVSFEGNVIGTPEYKDGEFQLFLTANTKFLNIKYAGSSPVLVKFNDYGIAEMPAGSHVSIEINEPEQDLSKELNSYSADVSDEAEEYYQKAMEYSTNFQSKEAFEWATKAYDLGHPGAAYYLATIYEDKLAKVRKNKKIAQKMKIQENPVEQDLEKAYSLYLESAKAGFVMAQFAVGECLEKGIGVKKDKNAAMEWYQKAADQGHLEAKDKVGEKVKKNKKSGVTIGYGSAANSFVAKTLESDPSDLTAASNGRKDDNDQYCALVKVVMPFENVSFEGDIVGEPLFKTNEYWVYMPQGSKELKVNYPEFTPLEVKFKNLGVDNLVTKTTYTLNVEFPFDLLRDDSNLTGEQLYNIGMGFYERKDSQYLRWVSKSADLEYAPALGLMGAEYIYGVHIDKDVKKGLDMLEKASAMGEGSASWNLGTYYSTFKHDKKKGQEWFDKASEQGFVAPVR